MEPLSVFRTIWRQRWLALPAIVLTIVAAALVFLYGPREYESTISYALVDPQVPTTEQIQLNPALGLLNSDNPYLRSSDPNLISNVLITRLNAESTQDIMKRQRLSDTYEAAPGGGGQGLIVTITASGESARQSLSTTRELGRIFQADLRTIQKINGADDRYLFTSIIVDQPDRATEKFSSRLRTVIIVTIAGVILVFGAVSLGNAIDRSRRRRTQKVADAQRAAHHASEAAGRSEDHSIAVVEDVPAPESPRGEESLRPAEPEARPEKWDVAAPPLSISPHEEALAEEMTEDAPKRAPDARPASTKGRSIGQRKRRSRASRSVTNSPRPQTREGGPRIAEDPS